MNESAAGSGLKYDVFKLLAKRKAVEIAGHTLQRRSATASELQSRRFIPLLDLGQSDKQGG